jgi:hypothetical protein
MTDKIRCPMKKKGVQCDYMMEPSESSVNNHLRMSHNTTTEQRTRLKIRLLGNLVEAAKEKKKARQHSKQEEKVRAKQAGIR